MTVRDIAMWFMSARTKAAAQAESRQWLATCSNCHATMSVWDMGGLRYKAAGRPVMRRKCPHCGLWSDFHVSWGGPGAAPQMHDTMLGFLGPEARTKAEAESKLWMVICPHCGAATSVWDMGGLKYKASKGGLQLWYTQCTHCQQWGAHRVHWTGGDPASVPKS